MFSVESYVTPILLSYVDKYVKDFRPADAQVSLWGGGVALHNLVLKADVLQQELSLPFTLVSGRIHELLIQVPWTKIISEPVVVTINTIECVLSLNPPDSAEDNPPADQPRQQIAEDAQGYMESLVRRVVANISVRVNSLIVKYVHDDVVLSLNVKRLTVDCVDGTWKPAFTEVEPNNFIMRRLVRLDDLTLCLDRSDSDGKIRHYQDPLLYRCQLEIRLLMSVTTMHKGSQMVTARNLSFQVRSQSLEWGVTSEQLILLLRLLRERPQPPPRPPSVPQAASAAPAAAASSNAAETAPNRESWTEWAWSWLPVLKEPEDAKTAIYQGRPFPIMFSAFFDKVSFAYKVTETEMGSNRKRTRPLLELTAHHTIMTYLVIAPTMLRVRIGARTFALSSQGKCVCGHLDQNALQDKPTMYVKPNFEVDEHYEWPEGIMEMKLVKPNVFPVMSEEMFSTGYESDPEYPQQSEEEDDDGYPPPELEPLPEPEDAFRDASVPHLCARECVEKAWFKMSPIVFLQYEHDREEPININDPYESPPNDFENSDWVERVQLSITMRPVMLRVCTGLIHRLELVHELLQDLPPVTRPEIVVRPLTVEECEALTEYTPERKIAIQLIGLVVQFTPWDHSLSDQPGEPIATIHLQTNKINVNISGPLYPSRVCAAACQMPDKFSELYDLANLRFSVNIMGATGHLETPVGRVNRPIFKFTAYFSGQFLLNSYLFKDNDTVHFSGIFTLPTEATMYMTAPAIETIVEVARSLLEDRVSTLLRDTTLAVDAMEEKDITAVDGVLTKLQFMPRVGRNAVMATVHVHSIKITGVQLRNGMEENVAWLFSAPDNKMSKEWMMFRFQYCPDASLPDALNYVFVETEVCAVSLDPLLMTFLTYRPRMRPQTKPMSKASSAKTMSSSKYFIRRRTTPPSSSGRGSRSGSAAELVHTRTRSAESTSERSERRERRDQTEPLSKKQLKLQGKRWDNEAMLGLYSRLRHTLLRLDIGLVMVYTVASTASALETSSVRDAMERHARHLHRVLVFSCGRWDIRSSGIDISDTASYHKPTFLPREMRSEQTFPWRIKVVDISSYTLETSPPTRLTDEDRELVRTQSQSRTTIHTVPRTMLALMNCNMTISVLTKTKETKKPPPPPDTKRPPPPTQEDQKKKYFTSGIDFKPMTLRDFIRGPAARPGARSDGRESPEPRPEPNPNPEQQSRDDGPLISLGLCIHGDTPPVNLTLAHDQVHIVRAAIHCLAHMWALLKKPRTPLAAPKPRVKRPGSAPLVRPVISSSTPAVALEQRSSSEDTPSENHSEKLIPIFQRTPAQDSSKQLRLFVWFQWVMYRASISFTTEHMMLTLDLDDAIATVDIQENYDQFRFKIATGTILYSTPKENTKPSHWNHWEPGPMGGRVLETRETPDGKSAHFFATTVTRARFADLPPNWREDLNIKRNRQNALKESMWEIFISTAPLEVMLHPQAVRGLSLVGTTLLLNSFCPVQLEQERVASEAAIQETESHQKVKPVPMPFLHVDLGGMRFILNNGQSRRYYADTVVVQFGSATVLPYPDNPICRRSINTVGEAIWIPAASGCEGRQHELIIKEFTVRTSRIQQLMKQMAELQERNKRNVNPAANWAEPLPRVMFIPILHNTDVSGVIAPPVFLNGALACGPALEINVASDVNVEISFEQLELLAHLLRDLYAGYADLHQSEDDKTILDVTNWCPFSELLVFDEEEDDDDEDDAADEAAAVSDSGMDMDSQPSTSRVPPPQPPKKAVSIAPAEPLGPFDHVEVFFVMGRVDIALYVRLDRSDTVQALCLLPSGLMDKDDLQAASRKTDPEPSIKIVIEPIKAESPRQDPELECGEESRSLTENIRQADLGRSRLNVVTDVKFVRRFPMYVPVMHVTLNQPNMYYWRKMNIKGLQMSLFNAWVALGEGQDEKRWHQPLLSTKPGAPDPDTDIPPSLLSARFDSVPASSLTDKQQWAVQVDIERPVVIDITEDSIHRIKCINALFAKYLGGEKSEESDDTHPLNKFHESMTNKCMEKLTVKTGQVALRWEPWTGGVDGISVQLCTARHPERLCARALLSALLLTTQHLTYGVEEPRHILLQPVMVGLQAEVSWKPALSEEVTITSLPAVRVALEMDDVAISVRPVDVIHAFRIHKTIIDNFGEKQEMGPELGTNIKLATERKPTPAPSADDLPLLHEVYYKDDLRSGAFKIMSGEKARMPMAYEVSLHSSTVVWHYPVPRFIARIVALPLPDCDEEADCVLESYNPLLGRWEANTYFQIPVAEKQEFRIYRPNNDKIFANLWRVRLVTNQPDNLEPFEFKPTKYLPQDDPVVRFSSPAEEWPAGGCIAAEQLAGALRVDSYLAAYLESRVHVALRFGTLAFHAYSATPPDLPLYPYYINLPHFEGIFVTLALRRSHRALSLVTRSAAFNAIAHAGARVLSCECMLGLDIYESETGTMERLVEDFRLQAVFNATHQRMRVRAGDVRIMVNAPRVRTLHMMQDEWKSPYYMLFDIEEYPDYEKPEYVQSAAIERDEHVEYTWNTDRLMVLESAAALDGRVYLYVVNSCDTPLRFGQEGTDEILTLNARTTLAYRWNSPLAPKRLRFAMCGTSTDVHWSQCIPYSVGQHRVRLVEENEDASNSRSADGVFLHARVEDAGDRLYMHLGGRVVLCNLLRDDLSYKVRIRDPTAEDGMRVIASGDMRAQSVGLTVLCTTAVRDAYLKIKFEPQPNGWTGDIPLKECPKEHVPWLVKVPSVGEVPCVSAWCRVERSADRRVTVLLAPMFVMCSHLPLDVNVSMTTDPLNEEEASTSNTPVLTQDAKGRGHITQLRAYGTTTVRHSLTFRYKTLLDCKVTQDTVPLHYGLTERSVFENHSPPPTADEMVADALAWINTSTSEAKREWPYSPVRNHWPGRWHATAAQPRCDVLVRYHPIRVCGGGCGMMMHVLPRVLVCNASSATLTIRADNGSPHCRLEPGSVSAPPSDIIANAFYVSIDEDNYANLSSELCVSREDPGVYGLLPSDKLAVDRTTDFVIHYKDRVAFLTMHYTMHMEIHVFGITSTYLFINKMDTDIIISPTVVQNLPGHEDNPILRPKAYQTVRTCKDELKCGVRITDFWLCGRYFPDEMKYLRPSLCFALPDENGLPAAEAVPVQLGLGLSRRSISLRDQYGQSIPVVVTQIKHEGRWIVTAALEPCPQFAVHNHTDEPLALAHLRRNHEAFFKDMPIMPEVIGVKWCKVIEPGAWSYYSTLWHMEHTSCTSMPNLPEKPEEPQLAVGRVFREFEPEWSTPFHVVEGEHLVQLTHELRIKVKIQKHPHSTNIDLLNVDEDDVSAMEIRERLAQRNDLAEQAWLISDFNRIHDPEKLLLIPPEWQEQIDRAVMENTFRSGNFPDKEFEPGSSKTAKQAREKEKSSGSITQRDLDSETSLAKEEIPKTCKSDTGASDPPLNDWVRAVVGRVVVELAATYNVRPLLRATVDRVALLLHSDTKMLYCALTASDFQLDNTQHVSRRFDFAVVATTCSEPRPDETFPALWGMFVAERDFDCRIEASNVVLRVSYDRWTVCDRHHQQIGDVDLYVGPTHLYLEDSFIREATQLIRLLVPQPELTPSQLVAAEAAALSNPLRLALLHIHELRLTLTVHTAVRLYIAVDHSTLSLSSFRLENMVTTPDKLMHDLTVHYLSGVILGAGWVVGGLELLGAPGALAARVANARGGVRGFMAATAAAVLRSVNACAGSLARNLDLLAGDDEHTQRAAAARRVHPPTFMAGISAGFQNFAVNMLGAVGGLAHHPLVGLAVGEASGAAALRRGLVGALAKPLSATADLLAFAGQGLLSQTGWDPDPKQRVLPPIPVPLPWRRDCVRWGFRLHTLPTLFGVDATLDDQPVRLVVTDKFLVVAEPTTERIVEMIDYRFCRLVSFDGQVVDMHVTQRRPHARRDNSKRSSSEVYPHSSSAAMARVARYAGVGGGARDGQAVRLRTAPYAAPALAAALAVALRQDQPTHFALL